MLDAFTWLFRIIGIAPIARNTRSYQLSSVGYLITVTHFTIVLYCYYVYKPVESRYATDLRKSGIISDIYLASWWYLTTGLRMTYVVAVLTFSGQYLMARNKMMMLEQKWAKLQTGPKRANWTVKICSMFGLITILFSPFATMVCYVRDFKSWTILILDNCDFLYLPATLLHFFLCLYEIKVFYDLIFEVLTLKKIK
jgi:hypothetical protein